MFFTHHSAANSYEDCLVISSYTQNTSLEDKAWQASKYSYEYFDFQLRYKDSMALKITGI